MLEFQIEMNISGDCQRFPFDTNSMFMKPLKITKDYGNLV